jgi:IS30 family transposase
LSFEEREQIALLRAKGKGVREIARELAWAASTISRELRRNAATRSGGLEYRATTAQLHIPAHRGHGFHGIVNADSGGTWSRFYIEREHC